MKHPLDGARLKFARAREHLVVIADEIREYIATRPYEVSVEQHDNRVTVRLPVVNEAPPLHISAVIGDCVVNLRAALDYIASQVAERYSKNLGQGRDIYFPLCDHPKNFNPKALLKHNVPPSALKQVESVQPYQSGYESLKLLRYLSNIDKHRLPLLTIGIIDEFGETSMLVSWFDRESGAYLSDSGQHTGVFGFPHIFFDPRGDQSLLPVSNKQVKIDCNLSIFVTWQDIAMPRESVDSTLAKMVECVENIVPRFESFF